MSTGSKVIISPNKIDEQTFKALIWSSAAVALPFVPFRLLARWKGFHKLFIDDALVVLAYSLLLAYAVFWHEYADDLYIFIRVSIGTEIPPLDVLNRVFKRWLAAQILHVFLSGFCLWSIKLAFLLFFRRLGQKVRYQKPIWWSVLIWNIVTFVVWMGIVQWQCIATNPERTVAICYNKKAIQQTRIGLKVQTATNVASDASILILPITLLWDVRINIRKKLTLGAIFSLTVFIMVVSLIRVVFVTSSTVFLDQSWFYPWSAIEMAVAVIVACLASFRTLFTSHPSSQGTPIRQKGHSSDPERHALKRLGFHKISRSLAKTPVAEQIRAIPPTFDPSSGKALAYVQARNSPRYGGSSEEEDIPSPMSSTHSSAPLEENQAHMRSEYSV